MAPRGGRLTASVALVEGAATEFEYGVQELPRGRFGFRRWRWELWRGSWLIASGWRTSPRAAERAICAAASRTAHESLGVQVLRPEQARPLAPLGAGATVRVDCGSVTCVLAPRSDAAAAA